jgi:hypothetical protein
MCVHRNDVQCTQNFCQKLKGLDPSRHRHNIKMDPKYIKGDKVAWIHLAEDRDQ